MSRQRATSRYITVAHAAALAMLSFAAPSPAHAAPVEQISCPHQQLTPDQNRFISEIVSALVNKRPSPHPGGEKESEKWIDAAITGCGTRHGWNEIDRENVKDYTALFYIRQGFRSDQKLSGVNFTALDAYALKLRPNGGHGVPTVDEKRGFYAQNIQAGVDSDNKPAMESALYYMITSFQMRAIEVAFAAGKPAYPVVSDVRN